MARRSRTSPTRARVARPSLTPRRGTTWFLQTSSALAHLGPLPQRDPALRANWYGAVGGCCGMRTALAAHRAARSGRLTGWPTRSAGTTLARSGRATWRSTRAADDGVDRIGLSDRLTQLADARAETRDRAAASGDLQAGIFEQSQQPSLVRLAQGQAQSDGPLD